MGWRRYRLLGDLELKLGLLVILLNLLSLAGAEPQLDAGMYQDLPYRRYVPSDVREGQKIPLILFLHGAGQRGHDNEAHPNGSDAQALIKGDELRLSGGSISLQSESHPVEFRRVELLPLER